MQKLKFVANKNANKKKTKVNNFENIEETKKKRKFKNNKKNFFLFGYDTFCLHSFNV